MRSQIFTIKLANEWEKKSALYQQYIYIYIINLGDALKSAWRITARKLHKQTKP